MSPYCPLVGEEELLLLVGATLDINRAGGANDLFGHPAGDDLDLHGAGDNLPVNTSSDGEEEGEYETGYVDRCQCEFIPFLYACKEEEDEDSGYDSDCEDEEDRPPVPAGTPSYAPFSVRQQLIPAQHQEFAPSASGFGSSTKRSRDESHTKQVSRKRQRRNPAPSTSGLGFSTKRSREESHTDLVSTKRQRRNCEDSSEDSPPWSSGLVFSSTRSSDEDYGDSAPSTSSGLVFSSTCWRDRSFYRWADDSDSD